MGAVNASLHDGLGQHNSAAVVKLYPQDGPQLLPNPLDGVLGGTRAQSPGRNDGLKSSGTQTCATLQEFSLLDPSICAHQSGEEIHEHHHVHHNVHVQHQSRVLSRTHAHDVVAGRSALLRGALWRPYAHDNLLRNHEYVRMHRMLDDLFIILGYFHND